MCQLRYHQAMVVRKSIQNLYIRPQWENVVTIFSKFSVHYRVKIIGFSKILPTILFSSHFLHPCTFSPVDSFDSFWSMKNIALKAACPVGQLPWVPLPRAVHWDRDVERNVGAYLSVSSRRCRRCFASFVWTQSQWTNHLSLLVVISQLTGLSPQSSSISISNCGKRLIIRISLKQ